jgi:hypothetical protein
MLLGGEHFEIDSSDYSAGFADIDAVRRKGVRKEGENLGGCREGIAVFVAGFCGTPGYGCERSSVGRLC